MHCVVCACERISSTLWKCVSQHIHWLTPAGKNMHKHILPHRAGGERLHQRRHHHHRAALRAELLADRPGVERLRHCVLPVPGAGNVLWRPCRRIEAALDRLGRRHHGPGLADVRAAAPAGRGVPGDDGGGQQCVRGVGAGDGSDDNQRKRNVCGCARGEFGCGVNMSSLWWFRLVWCKLAFMQHNWENMRWRCESCKLRITTEHQQSIICKILLDDLTTRQIMFIHDS